VRHESHDIFLPRAMPRCHAHGKDGRTRSARPRYQRHKTNYPGPNDPARRSVAASIRRRASANGPFLGPAKTDDQSRPSLQSCGLGRTRARPCVPCCFSRSPTSAIDEPQKCPRILVERARSVRLATGSASRLQMPSTRQSRLAAYQARHPPGEKTWRSAAAAQVVIAVR